MKIIALQAENVKKLTAVHIKPDGNMVEITGKNGQSKTTVLDCIWWALAGKENIQAVPIRKGAEQARIRLDLGELIVTRVFKKDKAGELTTTITVENEKGARFSSPQAMLDGLLGSLTFDPLAFSRMAPKDQFNQLRALVPGVDFEAIDGLNRADFAKRSELNRQALTAAGAASAIPLDENVPERVNVAELVDQLEKAAGHNADIETRKARRTAAQEEVKNGLAALSEITVKAVEEAQRMEADAQAEAVRITKAAKERAAQVILDAQAKAEALTNRVADLQNKLSEAPELPEPMDVAAIRQKVKEAETGNAAADRLEKRNGYLTTLDGLKEQAAALTKAMEAREEDKRAKISAAQLPVEGISFGDGQVLMAGVPFEQASDAEQLRASIAIAMALNPKLRVIRVRDGSLLDEESMKLLGQMADARDYQVWVERVDGSGKVGFVLEDGHVKEQEAVPA